MIPGSSLDKKLASWAEEGLISAYQAESIQAFESQYKRDGRRYVGRTTWKIVAAVLLSLGGVMLMASHWPGWPLWLRLGVLFAGIGFFHLLALFFIENKLAILKKMSWSVTPLSVFLRRDIAAILFWMACAGGLALVSQQYPVAVSLETYLRWLVWLTLPLMVILRSDVGALIVGLLSIGGAIHMSGAATYSLLYFPYWVMGGIWYRFGTSYGRKIQSFLALLWAGYLFVALRDLLPFAGYLPVMGMLLLILSSFDNRGIRFALPVLRILGLSLVLCWSLMVMWFAPAAMEGWMAILVALVGISLLLVWGRIPPKAMSTTISTIRIPAILRMGIPTGGYPYVGLFVMVTLFWMVCHVFFPGAKTVWVFLQAMTSLVLAVSLAWQPEKDSRILGGVAVVGIVGLLFFQPLFPVWMRAFVLIGGGVGVWAFVRFYRYAEVSESALFADDLGDVAEVMPAQVWPFGGREKYVLFLLLFVQWVVMIKPVVWYEWIRLTGEVYRVKGELRDPYDPFRGHYMEVRMADFEKEWPVVVPADADYAYLALSIHGHVAVPIALYATPPSGPYLRVPIRYKAPTYTVTGSPLDRVYMSEEASRAMADALQAKGRVWLDVYVKHGDYLLKDVITDS